MKKEWKQKITVERFLHFQPWLEKRPDSCEVWSTRKNTLLASLKSFAKLKECQLFLQWMELRLNLLKVQYDLRKVYFTVTWKNIDKSIFKNCFITSILWPPEKLAYKTGYQRQSKIRTFCPILTASIYEKRRRTFIQVWRQISHLNIWPILLDGLKTTVYICIFGNCWTFYQKASNIHKKGWTKRDFTRYIFSKRADRSILTIDSLTKQSVSSASAQRFLEITLNSFTTFLLERMNLEDQCDVERSEIAYPSMYQKVTEAKFMFFEGNF